MTSLYKEIKFSNPGTYQVEILGNAPAELWENFVGEVVKTTTNKNGQIISTLRFYVRDQIELSGVIDSLFRQRRILLSVNRANQLDGEADLV